MLETLVYKEAAGCTIELDVHRPENPNGAAIVWIHGGALINGSREMNPGQAEAYTREGYTVFSIDYRLAPETRLPEIVKDVRDAFLFVRSRGPELANIDPDRIAAAGGSAGGYLTLMTGTFDEPPKALAAYYGYGDLVGSWYAEPDPFYCTQPMVSEAEAREHHCGSPVTTPDQRSGGGNFYLYCRQQGTWPLEVGGVDHRTNEAFFYPYCPDRNVGPAYPPTVLIHGTEDTDVPYDRSVRMAEALEEASIEHQLFTVRGGGHGLRSGKGSPTDDDIEEARIGVQQFLARHLAG